MSENIEKSPMRKNYGTIQAKITEITFIAIVIALGLWITYIFHNTGAYDDVYLAYRCAKNIIERGEFAFNPGERVLVTPAPMFVSLIVIFKLLTPFTIPQVGSIVSSLSLTLLSIVVYLIAKMLNQKIVGMIASIMTLFNPLIVMTVGSETPLYLLLVSTAFYFYFNKKYNLTSFFLSLALLNRIEAIIPAGIIFLHYLYSEKKIPRKAVSVYLLTLSPWLIFATWYFGSPLTNSFNSKLAQRAAGLPPFLSSAISWITNVSYGDFNNKYIHFIIVSIIIIGIINLCYERKFLLVLTWIALQEAIYSVVDVPFYHWYIAPLGLGIAIILAFGLGVSFRKIINKKNSEISIKVSILILIFLIFMITSIINIQEVNDYIKEQPNPANKIYTKVGIWLEEHTENNASVAYLEIGQIGYYSNRKIVDTIGVVTPSVVPHFKKGNTIWVYLNFKPDYIIYNPIFNGWMGVLITSSWFNEAYKKVTEIKEPSYPVPLIVYKKINESKIPKTTYIDVAQNRAEIPVGEIIKNTNVGQTFKSTHNNLSAIGVKLATYARKIHGNALFALEDSKGNVIFKQKFSIDDVINNAEYIFYFHPIKNSEGREFYFHITSIDSKPGNAITIWASKKDMYKNGFAIKNGKPLKGDLCFKTYYLKN